MINDFSRTLSLLRREKKISQRKAAEALGVSQALLSHYENGVREPGLSFVVAAADYYKVSLDYLLGRTGNRDGMMISGEDLKDVSKEKDNVLKGSASAVLNKKLLINSTALLYEILGKSGSAELTAEISNYMNTAFFKAYRYVSSFDKSALPESFSVPDSCFSELCDASMKKSESKLRRESVKSAASPLMSFDVLSAEYPRLAPSLFSLLHTVSKQLESEM